MTEIGHGSDVAAIGTTATFDAQTDEFVIDTPFTAATKEYIGNAARDARAAVVFAQLITAGVNHGVHAFFVPVRDADGQPLSGITIDDDGFKGGLKGVDNGRFAFDQVRIPRTNLLDRYGAVDAEGAYSSPIDSPGRRFFTMLGTLVQGRVSLDGAAVVASKLALDIAIRYGSNASSSPPSTTTGRRRCWTTSSTSAAHARTRRHLRLGARPREAAHLLRGGVLRRRRQRGEPGPARDPGRGVQIRFDVDGPRRHPGMPGGMRRGRIHG